MIPGNFGVFLRIEMSQDREDSRVSFRFSSFLPESLGILGDSLSFLRKVYEVPEGSSSTDFRPSRRKSYDRVGRRCTFCKNVFKPKKGNRFYEI